jgi:hypothetical protein
MPLSTPALDQLGEYSARAITGTDGKLWRRRSTFFLFIAGILLFGVGTPVRAQEWTTINKDYSSQRYVDLDQITPQNVGDLKESCEFQLKVQAVAQMVMDV